MSRVASGELMLDRGEGVWVYDDEGNRYLDATAALWYCNVGHGRERLADAAREQMARLAGYQIFDDLANAPAKELAEWLCDLARGCGFGPGSAAFLTSGGSDGVETAAKICRRYWRLLDQPEKTVIIARSGGYHGMHAYGTTLAGIEANASGWGPLVADVLQVGRDDLSSLENALESNGGRVAAFIGEPVQGAAGVFPPNDGYWEGVQDLCRQHETLLVADEVVCGFGRLGRWFGSERFDIEPDLLIGAKGLSSGYSPVGMVLAQAAIADVMWSDEAGPMRHGYTYSGHPAACAVALENLRILDEEGLVERVATLEPHFKAAFEGLGDHPLVGEVRTCGLLAAVELTDDALQGGALPRAHLAARDEGVLTRMLVGRALQFSPSFVVTENEIDWLVERIEAALDVISRPS
jgi:putrescine aminotransferase